MQMDNLDESLIKKFVSSQHIQIDANINETNNDINSDNNRSLTCLATDHQLYGKFFKMIKMGIISIIIIKYGIDSFYYNIK